MVDSDLVTCRASVTLPRVSGGVVRRKSKREWRPRD